MEDIEEAADDLLQVPISSPCLFSLACPFCGVPPLLLTLPVMVIYLVGKGSSFSPERDRQKGVGEVQKRERRERSTNRSKEQKISLALVSQVTTTVSLTAVMELKLWPQTVRERLEEKKRIPCQYLFPQAAWIEKDTLHSLSRPP